MKLAAAFGAALTIAAVAASGARAQPQSAQVNTPEALRGEAFEAAQWALASDAAEALAKVAARFAHGEGPLAQLAARRERQIAERDLLERKIEEQYAQAGSGDAAARAETRRQYGEVAAALKATDDEIGRSFPDYADLTSPRPLAIAQVQALLKPDEALILILVNDEASYSWGVTSETVVWARAEDFGSEKVTASVVRLRQYLSGAAGGEYDRVRAFELYDRLLRPVEGAFAGKRTLISVTGGALATLPLGVLVTDRDAPKTAGWLIDRYALASLPAVSSLRALRCLRVVAAQRPAGCPPLPAGGPAPVTVAAGGVPMVGFGAPAGLAAPERTRAPPPAQDVFRGGLADPARLRALASLPGSQAELRALKARYPTGLVMMGDQATETAVKVTHRQAMARSRYVVFSTHGLMAGEMGSAEPGLVLTPPIRATETDDGYLSASEAAQLQLSADFVVLSACNTAASDGAPGGQGLSGLARSFFYAGARSVLVSHWAVFDDATLELIKATFGNLEGRDAGSRARALQHAVQTVRADPRFADPSAWGAFTLVGEPER